MQSPASAVPGEAGRRRWGRPGTSSGPRAAEVAPFSRAITLAAGRISIANERSDSVAVLRLDDKLPRPTGLAVERPAPTYVLPPNLPPTPA
jgi:hypothetical protein